MADAAGLARSRVEEVLELLGVIEAADRRVAPSRSACGSASVSRVRCSVDPEVLLLDEPLNGLDPEGIRWVRSLLQGLAGEGRTVFVSSHLLHEMEHVAQRVVVIAHGRFVDAFDIEIGRAATVRVRPASTRLAAALRAAAAATVTPIEDGLDVSGLPAERVGEAALECGIALRELVERFTEEARRRQIVDCTIELVAERGAAAASLSAIAARAGISKAAVLYHFTSKDAVLDATMRHVLTSYATAVGERVDATGGPEEMLVAYLRGTLTYMRDHPAHVRVLVEGLVRDPTSPPARRRSESMAIGRGDPRAGAGGRRLPRVRPRVLALMINGALDGVVAEWIGAPDLDLDTAAAELETAVLLAVRSPGKDGSV